MELALERAQLVKDPADTSYKALQGSSSFRYVRACTIPTLLNKFKMQCINYGYCVTEQNNNSNIT